MLELKSPENIFGAFILIGKCTQDFSPEMTTLTRDKYFAYSEKLISWFADFW